MFEMQGWELNSTSGFLSVWPVHKNYRIENAVLIGEGEIAYHYSPIEHSELPSEVAKLDADSPEDLIAFAKTYGLFGYVGTLTNEDRIERTVPDGEPVWWIRQHIETVRLVLELASCLTDDDTKMAEQRAQQLYDAHLTDDLSALGLKGARARTPVFSFAARGSRRLSPDTHTFSDSMEWAAYAACEILGHNLSGVIRQPIRNKRTVKSTFSFEALIDVVYWQVQNGIDGGALKLCKECRKPFISTHGRQVFCPPRYQYKNKDIESPCAVAYRQKKYRAKP